MIFIFMVPVHKRLGSPKSLIQPSREETKVIRIDTSRVSACVVYGPIILWQGNGKGKLVDEA